ncbi:MAG: MmcQ/YjbR family DNA-binding protein [Coriobacteriia bacterium]|nr:MmcQ/YjbR family DNA-binding protein [Coriobacteriia bacterium]
MDNTRLDAVLLAKKGVEKDFKAEWEWWRYLIDGKMFAALLRPSAQYDPKYAERDLLTLKCDPLYSEQLRAEYSDILPGFYTDKRNWISIRFDGAVPDELIVELCEHSYQLVLAKLTKKRQCEINELE